jgi:hypothetical protein
MSLISKPKQEIGDRLHQAAPNRVRYQGKQTIMTSFKFARFALPALTAAIVGLGAQAALAQTTTAPSQMMQGSMSQGSMMAAPAAPAATATTAKKHHHMAGHALPASEKFSSVATAQAHCPGDAVVWINVSHSHVFHASSSKYFGKTKHGAYVCEKTALAAGLHASKR